MNVYPHREGHVVCRPVPGRPLPCAPSVPSRTFVLKDYVDRLIAELREEIGSIALDGAFVPLVMDSDGGLTAATVGTRAASTGIGPRSFTVGDANTASGGNSFAQGCSCQATGLNSVALGYKASASYVRSFVWSGVEGSDDYKATGPGTFHVNPVGGAAGFFIGTTSLSSLLAGAGTTNYEELINKPSINGVTLEGNKTASDLGLASSDEALLAIYYPEGNVTSVDQITTNGLEYSYNDATMTATLTNGLNATGDIVIPWKVVMNGVEYKVTAVWDSAFAVPMEMISANISSVVAPITVTGIGQYAFSYCNLTSVSFPSVTNIAASAFEYCNNLKSVSFPSATTIENNAFGSCNTLTSVSFPSVTDLRGVAFANCLGLKSVSLPSVTAISSAFYGCEVLESIDFGSTPRDTVPPIDSYAFDRVPTSCKIIVPLGMYDEWIAAEGWKDLYADGYKFMGYADAGDLMNGITLVSPSGRKAKLTLNDDLTLNVTEVTI